jgi:hypothetical protein
MAKQNTLYSIKTAREVLACWTWLSSPKSRILMYDQEWDSQDFKNWWDCLDMLDMSQLSKIKLTHVWPNMTLSNCKNCYDCLGMLDMCQIPKIMHTYVWSRMRLSIVWKLLGLSWHAGHISTTQDHGFLCHDTLNIIKTARTGHVSTTQNHAYLRIAKQNTLNIIKMLGLSWHVYMTQLPKIILTYVWSNMTLST